MSEQITIASLRVAKVLYDFIEYEALPGTGVNHEHFWNGVAGMVRDFGPRNRELLATRNVLQEKIDNFHRTNAGNAVPIHDYKRFLQGIGYLVPEVETFMIRTSIIDPEIAEVAGPQLVVPINNARYALNAANARWGSLYDALYGTDAIPEEDGAVRTGKYNPQRGAKVIAFARRFLDEHFALAEGSHRDAVAYRVAAHGLAVQLDSGGVTGLKDPAAFRGSQGEGNSPTVLLLVHHGLHVELHVDRTHYIGRDDPAGVSDVLLESAITTVQDCEDSVAAVDADAKGQAYRNWLGLMNGSLEARLEKDGKAMQRRLNADRQYRTLSGGQF